MADKILKECARQVSVPFISGAFFILVPLGLILAFEALFEALIGSGYALTNQMIEAANYNSFNLVILAVLIGEAVLGWKEQSNTEPKRSDFVADIAQTLADNLYFLLGLGFGFLCFALFMQWAGLDVDLPIPKVVVALLGSYAIAWAIEVIRQSVRPRKWKPIIFGGLAAIVLIILWWNA